MALKTPVIRVNKWACLGGAGAASLTGYGINEVVVGSGGDEIQSLISKGYIDLRTNEIDASPTLTGNVIVPMSLSGTESSASGENQTIIAASASQVSDQTVIQDSQIVTDPNAAVDYSEYTTDAAYVNSLWSSSMGWKFRNHVILAPKSSKVWSNKAFHLKNRARTWNHHRGLFVWKDQLYNGWNREWINLSTMDGNKVHSMCTTLLYQNDYGIWFSWGARLNGKWFFDFIWEACGREDKTKPANWRYAK